MSPEPNPARVEVVAAAERKRRLPIRVLGLLLTAISLFALGMAGYSAWLFREHVHCQAAYNDYLNERTRILTDVGAAERAAERRRGDALDAALLDPAIRTPTGERSPADMKRIQDLYAEYVDAARDLQLERAAADAARIANPVPPPPSQVCGRTSPARGGGRVE